MPATRQIAVLEFAKGALVLVTGAGLIELVHAHAQQLAEDVVRLFHLNPSSHYPRIFLDLAGEADSRKLWLLAAGAAAYAAIRFAEAWGLWRNRAWAVWLGILSGLIYVPWEILEVAERLTGPRMSLLLLNVIVVWVLLLQVRAERTKWSAGHPPAT